MVFFSFAVHKIISTLFIFFFCRHSYGELSFWDFRLTNETGSVGCKYIFFFAQFHFLHSTRVSKFLWWLFVFYFIGSVFDICTFVQLQANHVKEILDRIAACLFTSITSRARELDLSIVHSPASLIFWSKQDTRLFNVFIRAHWIRPNDFFCINRLHSFSIQKLLQRKR